MTDRRVLKKSKVKVHAYLGYCNSRVYGSVMNIVRMESIVLGETKTRGQSNLTKSASRGAIPRLGVTPGGRNLYH